MGWISYASFLAQPSSIHEILPHRFKGRISFVQLNGSHIQIVAGGVYAGRGC